MKSKFLVDRYLKGKAKHAMPSRRLLYYINMLFLVCIYPYHKLRKLLAMTVTFYFINLLYQLTHIKVKHIIKLYGF